MTFKKWIESRKLGNIGLTEDELKVIYKALKSSTSINLPVRKFNIWRKHMKKMLPYL